MSETGDQHSHEYLCTSRSICETLRYEMEGQKHDGSFNQYIALIARVYDSTPMFCALTQYSRVYALSHVVNEKESTPRPIDEDFYRGSILALHAVSQSLERDARFTLLSYDLFHEYRTDAGTYKMDKAELQSLVDSFVCFGMGDIAQSFNDEPEDIQELLVDAAILSCTTSPNVRFSEDSFIAGFIATKDTLVSTLMSMVEHNALITPPKIQAPVP